MRTSSATTLRNVLRECSKQKRTETYLEGFEPGAIERILNDWELWAREDQLPPQNSWTTWLILGGRGAGKTRAGAQWVRAVALEHEAARIALIGETLNDVRSVMVEGVSGLLGVHLSHERPVFEPSKKQITWANGAIAQIFSAEDPESLRGPQFSHAWCDVVYEMRNEKLIGITEFVFESYEECQLSSAEARKKLGLQLKPACYLRWMKGERVSKGSVM